MPNWDNKLKLQQNTIFSVINFTPTLKILHHFGWCGWWHFSSLARSCSTDTVEIISQLFSTMMFLKLSLLEMSISMKVQKTSKLFIKALVGYVTVPCATLTIKVKQPKLCLLWAYNYTECHVQNVLFVLTYQDFILHSRDL